MVKKSSTNSQKSEYNKFIDNKNKNPNFFSDYETLVKNPSIQDFNKLFGKNVKTETSLKGAMRRMKNGMDMFGSTIEKKAFKNAELDNGGKVIANKIKTDTMFFNNDKFKKRVVSLINNDTSIEEAIRKANLISRTPKKSRKKLVGTNIIKVPVKSKKSKKKTTKKSSKKYKTVKIRIGREELDLSNEVYEND